MSDLTTMSPLDTAPLFPELHAELLLLLRALEGNPALVAPPLQARSVMV